MYRHITLRRIYAQRHTTDTYKGLMVKQKRSLDVKV